MSGSSMHTYLIFRKWNQCFFTLKYVIWTQIHKPVHIWTVPAFHIQLNPIRSGHFVCKITLFISIDSFFTENSCILQFSNKFRATHTYRKWVNNVDIGGAAAAAFVIVCFGCCLQFKFINFRIKHNVTGETSMKHRTHYTIRKCKRFNGPETLCRQCMIVCFTNFSITYVNSARCAYTSVICSIICGTFCRWHRCKRGSEISFLLLHKFFDPELLLIIQRDIVSLSLCVYVSC